MLERLFPRVADNNYPGRRLGIWLFALLLLKIGMGLNVMFNAPEVARTADGIPVDEFAAPAAAAFSFLFAAWGLAQLVFGLTILIVLFRYRRLIPLAFLVLLLEQVGRGLLKVRWPVERIATAPGGTINLALTIIMLLGLLLSLWPPPKPAAGA